MNDFYRLHCQIELQQKTSKNENQNNSCKKLVKMLIGNTNRLLSELLKCILHGLFDCTLNIMMSILKTALKQTMNSFMTKQNVNDDRFGFDFDFLPVGVEKHLIIECVSETIVECLVQQSLKQQTSTVQHRIYSLLA
jgi:hypothetical protein